ncbi:MAG: HAMP domain-containing histidine kinase [Pirellulales bacterium]|nr:HAMP domain-containing histidine kinase [Pirellulales bacterium]
MRWALRNQILLPWAIVSITGIGLIGGIYVWLAADLARQRIEQQLRGMTNLLDNSSFPLTASILRQMKDLSGAEFVLTDKEGRSTSASFPTSLENLSVVGFVTTPNDISLNRTLTFASRDYFHSSVRMKPRPGINDTQFLHILFPREEYLGARRAAIGPPLVVGLVSLVAVVAVAHMISNRIGRTTARLGKEVQRLAEGDYMPLELPHRNDELLDLTIAINHTAQRLANYEQEVRRTEQMRTIALLGAGLAHEMRNAATGCRMALDLHGEHCPVAKDDEAFAMATRQLSLLERQLQSYLRMGKQTTNSPKQKIELNDWVEHLLPLVRPAAEHASIHIAWVPSDGHIFVLADTDALSQVLLNLVKNALEAAQYRAVSTGTSGHVWVESKIEDGTAHLLVSDNGLGPNPPIADSMFEPFTTGKSEGVGLGLTVSKQVVEEHGGSIGWRRLENKTEFRVTLPLAEKELSHG